MQTNLRLEFGGTDQVLTQEPTVVATPRLKEWLPFRLRRRQGRNQRCQGPHESEKVNQNKETMFGNAAWYVEDLDKEQQLDARSVWLGQNSATEPRPISHRPATSHGRQICLRFMFRIAFYLLWVSLFAMPMLGLLGAFDLRR